MTELLFLSKAEPALIFKSEQNSTDLRNVRYINAARHLNEVAAE